MTVGYTSFAFDRVHSPQPEKRGQRPVLLRKVLIVATLFKSTRTIPLPSNPELVEKDGKPHISIRENRKTVLYPLTEDRTHFLKPAAVWCADIRLADGSRKRVRFSPNHDASTVLMADLLKKIENEKAGIGDPFEAHSRKSLAEHLTDWIASLRANGRNEKYVALKAGRVRSLVEACGWVFPGDMNVNRLETFLADLRNCRPDLPKMPDGVESFTVREVGTLLGGLTRHHVAALIRRHKLAGVGKGKARRFSRATVETLRGLKDHGCSSQTSNHYLQAVHQFARWMADNGRMVRSPFTRLKPMNTRLDVRRRRGELAPAEMGNLLVTAGISTTEYRGLSGTDRAMLYRVAVGTGLRAAELAAVTPNHFDLDATQPAVILPAEFTKNRKGAVQPLPATLIVDLRTYLSGRDAKKPVWPGGWHTKAADMLRVDLDAAGVAVEIDGPEGIETRDFHALRACFISNVIRAGADIKQAMTLARHSDPKLTAGRYARVRLHDLGAVVDRLPTTASAENLLVRMTGTDDCGVLPAQQGAAKGAAAGGDGWLRLRTGEDVSPLEGDEYTTRNGLVGKELGLIGDAREELGKRPRPDSNRGIAVLQTAALPLGYEADGEP